MSMTKSINIRVDAELKNETETILRGLGLPTSTVVSMLFRTIVRTKSVPPELFSLTTKEERNAAYLAMLDKSFAQYEAGMAEPHELLPVSNE